MTLQLSDPSLLQTQAYINGQWVSADDGATVAVTNPANGELIVNIAKVGEAETRRAIEAAHKPMGGWKALQAKSRANSLRKW